MKKLEDLFPGLASSPYRVTSPPDPQYNCVGWAAGNDGRWWWPDHNLQYFWPEDVPRECTLAAFVMAYATLGYAAAETSALEEGFEKTAVFVGTDGTPTHAARQLPDGRWTSKLGRLHDIEHELAALEGDAYGRVALVMKRLRKAGRSRSARP